MLQKRTVETTASVFMINDKASDNVKILLKNDHFSVSILLKT